MMKMMRKTRLAMAVGGAIAGAVAAGGALAQGSDQGMGQILVFPYYTVNGGWNTLFNVTNTTSAAVAVKVRFHEAQNSRDVLDFNILMSPYDAWTGWIEPNAATGGMVLKTTDNSCTSPIFDGSVGLPASRKAYTGEFADTGSDSPSRLAEGYAEFLVMGMCTGTSLTNPTSGCFSETADGLQTGSIGPGIGYLTRHVDGVPRDCKTADSYFEARDSAWNKNGAPNNVPGNGNPIAAGVTATPVDPRGYGPVSNAHVLKGNLTLVNVADGVAGGDAALSFSNVIPPCYYTPDDDGGTCPPTNLVTAQQFPWFLEPTLATAPSGQVWNAAYLGDIESEINEAVVINEWSSNPDLGVATDWVVTFPSKGFHVDQFCDQIQANNNQWRFNGTTTVPEGCASSTQISQGLPPGSYDTGTGTSYPVTDDGERYSYPALYPFDNRFLDGKSDITVSYNLYDREEGTQVASGTAPSPAKPDELPAFPYESNVLGFTSAEDPNSAVASQMVQPIDASAILSGAPYGWMQLLFENQDSGVLPVTGFMVKTRTFGTPDMHYGQITDHGYRRHDFGQ